jgi:hypothetical protein
VPCCGKTTILTFGVGQQIDLMPCGLKHLYGKVDRDWGTALLKKRLGRKKQHFHAQQFLLAGKL